MIPVQMNKVVVHNMAARGADEPGSSPALTQLAWLSSCSVGS